MQLSPLNHLAQVLFHLTLLILSCVVMHDISLCHRPRNCNLSNLCGRCKILAPEIVSWFRFRFAESLAPPAKGSLRSPFASCGLSRLRRSCSRFALDFSCASGARIWVNCLESSLWQRLAWHMIWWNCCQKTQELSKSTCQNVLCMLKH